MDPLDTYRRRITAKEILYGLAIVIVTIILLYLLWRILDAYVDPGDKNATEKKDLVQAFALIVGGFVAFGTLLIGWRNLRHNQRTLLVSQQNTQETLTTAQEVETRRAQNDALQSYFEQIGTLLLDNDLRNSLEGSEVRILAQAQTHTVLPALNAERKRSVLIFLYKSNLLDAYKASVVGLIGADLSAANLRDTHLPRINLREANLQGAILEGANLQGAHFQKADLQEVVLRRADLRGAILEGARLQEANLQNADLREANLREANLQGAILEGANLQGARLGRAILEGAHLQEANLLDAFSRRASLENADLRGANLEGVSFEETNLEGANLEGARLQRADLRGANLEGARLRGAKVTDEQLADARSLIAAIMPDGSKHT